MTPELVKRLRELLQPDMCNITPSVYTAIAVAADAIEAETRRANEAEARVRELEAEVLHVAFAAAQLLAHDYDATVPGRWPERQLRELFEKIRDRRDAEKKT